MPHIIIQGTDTRKCIESIHIDANILYDKDKETGKRHQELIEDEVANRLYSFLFDYFSDIEFEIISDEEYAKRVAYEEI